jgi:hypothetical protein
MCIYIYIYIPHALVHGFLKGERGDLNAPIKWNIFKNVFAQKEYKKRNN